MFPLGEECEVQVAGGIRLELRVHVAVAFRERGSHNPRFHVALGEVLLVAGPHCDGIAPIPRVVHELRRVVQLRLECGAGEGSLRGRVIGEERPQARKHRLAEMVAELVFELQRLPHALFGEDGRVVGRSVNGHEAAMVRIIMIIQAPARANTSGALAPALGGLHRLDAIRNFDVLNREGIQTEVEVEDVARESHEGERHHQHDAKD
mmetsp:Transcript_62425/g.190898  ORF Transcript_62425/g.190898 Transcript_62425/m.190898 type:complete len:207 (-) Transcript_62425:141-761(-)